MGGGYLRVVFARDLILILCDRAVDGRLSSVAGQLHKEPEERSKRETHEGVLTERHVTMDVRTNDTRINRIDGHCTSWTNKQNHFTAWKNKQHHLQLGQNKQNKFRG